MDQKQEIVPVRLDDSQEKRTSQTQTKTTKLAFQVTDPEKNRTIRVYNGIDKYILYALLKGLNE